MLQNAPLSEIARNVQRLQCEDVNTFKTGFPCNPQTFETVFTECFCKIVPDGMYAVLTVENDEVVAVIATYSSSFCRCPKKALAVFDHIFHKTVGQSFVYTQGGDPILFTPFFERHALWKTNRIREDGKDEGKEELAVFHLLFL